MSTAEFICLIAGRRAGKTDAFALRMVKLCSQYDGMRYMYITPLSYQGLAVFNKIINHPAFKPYISRVVRRPYPCIYFENDTGEEESFIIFRSLQRGDNLVSEEWDEIIIDESQANEVTQEIVEGILSPMLRGRIARHGDGFQRGTLIMGGQFRGKDWRYENYWLPGMPEIDGQPNKAKRPKYQSWRKKSSEGWAFGVLPGGAEELEDIKKKIPARIYSQMYECFPGGNLCTVFDAQYLDKCITGTAEAFKQDAQYICGIDPGRQKDFTAVVVMRVWKNGRDWYGHVVHDEQLEQVQHEIQARQAAAIAKRYNAACVVDCTGNMNGGHYSNQPSETVELYRKEIAAAGLTFHNYKWNVSNKNQVIENLQVAIEQQHITMPACFDVMTGQMRAFEYTYHEKTHRYFYNAPANLHDDHVSALAAALDGARQGMITFGPVYRGGY